MSQLAQRLIMAAGGGKKETTYLDDVFSTYLYKGNASATAINNGIKLGNSNFGNSVGLDGTGDWLTLDQTNDLAFGTGDFTMELWVYLRTGGYTALIDCRPAPAATEGLYPDIYFDGSSQIHWFIDATQKISGNITIVGQWNHIAVSRSGTSTKMFINGTQAGSTYSDSNNYLNGDTTIGTNANRNNNGNIDGFVSNVRIVKGQALYTANFTPSTEPFTTTSQGATASNVKLLCCNKDTVTGSTVTPGTITAFGNPTASNFGTGTASDGKGGMVWIKDRTNAYNHVIQDTVRGAGATTKLSSNLSDVQGSGDNAIQWSGYISGFNNDGFSLDKTGSGSIDWANVNKNNDDYASWAFAIQEGFLDIQTWDGNNTAGRQLPHNLGSVPGCIMVKSISNNSGDWMVYHRGVGNEYRLKLNSNTNKGSGTASWNDTTPTSTYVELGSNTGVNASGTSYVGYFFAGGASTAATARSVFFGGDASLVIPSSSDLTLGTGDFTIETWVFPQTFGNRCTLYDGRSSGGTTGITIGWESTSGQVRVYMNATSGSDIVVQSDDLELRQWQHIAVTRSSGTVRLFINGVLKGSATRTSDLNNTNAKIIGYKSYTGSSYDHYHGQISNFRLVKGTAVYTSSFKPSTQPLTDITNTKLLCCNNASVTGATVTPGTITVGTGGFAGNPVAYADNPFDDPEGYKFGEEGDQNIIKTGSYRGNHSTNGPFVEVGFEPQWVMVKNISTSGGLWLMGDNMRGVVTGAADPYLQANGPNDEYASYDWIEFTPTGFKLTATGVSVNQNDVYVYIAIRRPDPLVAKPAEVGTDAFSMVMSTASATIPTFYGGFPVDFSMAKQPASATDWYQQARLLGMNHLVSSSSAAKSGMSWGPWDSNEGWGISFSVYHQSWMWKRGAGFDVVNYNVITASGQQQIRHNLGREPEMIWLKSVNVVDDWLVYNKYLGGGTDPWDYFVRVDRSNAQTNAYPNYWGTSASDMNENYFTINKGFRYTGPHIMFLFASVDGISSLGSYSPTSSSTTVNCGFQPRFVLVKAATKDNTWNFGDSLRGLTAGNDPALVLNENWENDKYGSADWIDVSATGFTVNSTGGSGTADANSNGETYIYYAHA